MAIWRLRSTSAQSFTQSLDGLLESSLTRLEERFFVQISTALRWARSPGLATESGFYFDGGLVQKRRWSGYMKHNNLHYRSFRVSWFSVFQIRFVDWLISFRPLVPSSPVNSFCLLPVLFISFFPLTLMLHFLLILFDLFWCFWLAWFLSLLCAGHNVHGKSVATSSLPWFLLFLFFSNFAQPCSNSFLLFHLLSSISPFSPVIYL